MLNKEDKKQMVEIVGEALEGVVLPAIQEVRNNLADFKKETKQNFRKADERFDNIEKRLDGVENSLDNIETRLEKVEKNTEVYPYDKEYVDDKLNNHETRISKLELKKA